MDFAKSTRHHIELGPTLVFRIGGPVSLVGGDIAIASALAISFPDTVFRIREEGSSIQVLYLGCLEFPDGRRVAIGPTRSQVDACLRASFPEGDFRLPLVVRKLSALKPQGATA